MEKRTRGVGAEHDARRREIVEALLAVISEQGLDGVSLREVASRAEVSVGRVQHYFRTKDQMLEAAFQQVNALGATLVAERLAGETDPRAVLRAVALELLPIDDLHRHALQIGAAFTARAVVEPTFTDRLREGYGELRELFTLLLTQARAAGRTAPNLNVPHEADLLLSLFEGLSTHTLIGHHTTESAMALIDTHLDRLFTP